MSKSRGNVINPDHVVDEFGADSLRLFEMFMGPLENTKPWSTQGVEGVYRFLGKVWRLVIDDDGESGHITDQIQECAASKPLLKVLHATIKKVSEDCESLSFNTAIAQMMVCCGALKDAEPRPIEALVSFLHVLNPYAPHLTEELYARLRAKFPEFPDALLSDQPWPDFDERHLVESEIEIVVQVNGKLRDRVLIPAEASNPAHEQAALASTKIQEHIAGKTVRKVIVVPKKLVNIVAN
jgi:leucyl-tRNA synthetase